ncbi:STAS/SEC14 domain-containing protein [Salipiger mangrovisoli]|uniref:STAS/SEC14 domain-containing protein n=1 Tax=Salipiger mangrovisoli TaxID=2865933 RepID=A0ABR9WYF0_9RHOB|nr:STAS/SEC14 domain-containing protein [Salipiger mangrovisoli]MBE9636340.1 STAS/SEC14 domain-containing protein [Salipiger mangrovisoli]
MIDVQDIGEHGIIELRMTPPVTDADYRDTLMPALDAALTKGDRLRLLAIVEARPSEFTLGAMIQDARTGLKHWRGFDRIALVSDDTILRKAVGGFSVFMPCPVATFAIKDADDARRWLRESLGSIQQDDLGNGVLQVRLRGKVDGAAYDAAIGDLDTFFAAHETVRLLIDLRDFDGWQGLDALRDHFYLVRGHADRVKRAAIVGDAGWQDMAVQVGKRAFGLDARYFAAADFARAEAWLAG